MNNERGMWNHRGRSPRGGLNRGGHRGGYRGQWSGNRRNFNQNNFGGFRGGNRSQSHNSYGNNFARWNNKPRDSPGKRLSEDEIGVTEYITDHEGFNGIIKSRYSDFQVSEINESGEVAKLTDQTPPQPPEEETVDEDEDLLLNKYNLEILPMERWDQINSVAVGAESAPDKVEIDVTGMSKDQRTKIHDAVKKAFGDIIIGSTVNEEDKKLMRFEKFKKGVRIDNRVKWIWPGEYVYFVVHKENCDTMDAALRITERLRLNIKPSMLGYAGTKDRRAKTSQWFSLRRVDPRRVASSTRDLRDVRVGNYRFHHSPLRLGMLQGNMFRIALRNVTAEDEYIETACRNLRDHGFINYYGLQRFGSRVERPTYDIGLKLLQGKFKEAIDAILEERESGWGGGRRAPQHELRLRKALGAAPNDLVGALGRLARNTRLLYLHSYQSLVWNRAVSERLRRLGLQPAVGDLVPLADVEEQIEEEEFDPEDGQDGAETTEDGGDKQDGGDQIDEQKDKEPSETTDKQKKERKDDVKPKIPVKILTQEDVDSDRYTIFDIIMPLPGFNIDYPPNMKDFYEATLVKDGLTLELRHKYKSYSMSGAYRRVAQRPSAVSWRCVRYQNPFADLLASDWDTLTHRDMTAIVDDGKYKALLLTFNLPASCYATMALRELLKVDTSSDNQALQNNYHKRKESEKTEDDPKNTGEDGKDSVIDGKKTEVDDKNTEEDGKKPEEDGKKNEEDSALQDDGKRKCEDDGEGDSKKQKTDE